MAQHLSRIDGVNRRSALALGLGLAGVSIFVSGQVLASPLEKLIIVTSGGRQTFEVEQARTDEERARGLMFRRTIAPDYGMLFDFGAKESDASMWMKNTYIPLDMLFIRADGTIRSIAENTVPFSTDIIASGGPIKAVLEVQGGTARRLGLKPGDKVEHPLFGK